VALHTDKPTVLTLCVIAARDAPVKQWQLRRHLAKAPALPLSESRSVRPKALGRPRLLCKRWR